MIQRIQSVYLLLAGIVSAISIFFPMQPGRAWVVASGLIAIACFLTVFAFRNRMRQKRMCGLWMTLCSLQVIAFAVFAFHNKEYDWSILLPLVSELFLWLASRAIARDEALVRAADRIR